MPEYLVTGAAGFIASKVCEFLLDEGNEVVGIDNMDPAYDLRLKRWRLSRLLPRRGFTFFEESICDLQALERIINNHANIQAIINLAAKAGVRDSVIDPWAYYDTNLTGTLNLLELCRRHGIRKFILASTSSIYGQDAPYPTPEEAESSYPLQPYAASKKAAETLSYSYHYLYGTDISVVRYFTVYGPRQRPDMGINKFVTSNFEGKEIVIFGDGTQTRDFTYIDDAVYANILAANSDVSGEVFNIGGGNRISVNDLIFVIEQATGRRAIIRYTDKQKGDVIDTLADNSKARRILGWEPRVDIRDGISHYVSWRKNLYQNQGFHS